MIDPITPAASNHAPAKITQRGTKKTSGKRSRSSSSMPKDSAPNKENRPMDHETTTANKPHMNGTKASQAKEKVEGTAQDIGGRARDGRARGVMRFIEREVQEHPLRSLGVAAGVGLGVGALVVTRLGRMLLVSGGGYVVKEVVRSRLKSFLTNLS